MAKKQWLLLGALGTIVGAIAKLLRTRRSEEAEPGRWEPPPADTEAT